jgi:hypothetical protein
MNAGAMGSSGDTRATERKAALSLRAMGRLAGVSYLGIFVAGFIYMALIPNTGLLSKFDAATVDYFVAHLTAFRTGFPFLLIVVACRLILMLLFYELFTPVNRRTSLLAVYFNVVATSLQAGMAIALLVPIVLLGGEPSLAAFTPAQLHALAIAAINLYNLTYYVALAFFGVYDLLLGYLTFKSGLFPRPVGLLMCLSGLGWLTFADPPFAAGLLPYNLAVGLFGEVVMILWLIARGVDSQRWEERASAGGA